MGPVYLMALFATAVCVYEYALEAGTLPANFPDIAVGLDISGPFGLSTFALSLLLAYRTNASYGRFDEARKFWGGVVNRSRDIMRQVWWCFVMERSGHGRKCSHKLSWSTTNTHVQCSNGIRSNGIQLNSISATSPPRLTPHAHRVLHGWIPNQRQSG